MYPSLLPTLNVRCIKRQFMAYHAMCFLKLIIFGFLPTYYDIEAHLTAFYDRIIPSYEKSLSHFLRTPHSISAELSLYFKTLQFYSDNMKLYQNC